jgi:hypothetical protein
MLGRAVNLYFYNKIQKYINAETKILSGGDENQGIYFIWPKALCDQGEVYK